MGKKMYNKLLWANNFAKNVQFLKSGHSLIKKNKHHKMKNENNYLCGFSIFHIPKVWQLLKHVIALEHFIKDKPLFFEECCPRYF